MASFVHLIDQRRLIGPGGSTTGGSIFFYLTGTTVKAPIYQDAALLIPAANPVVVAAGQIIPLIFLDATVEYRRVIQYLDGSFDEQDPLGNVFSEGELGLPVGGVIDFSGATAPAGFVFCYGQELSRTEYSELFDVISTQYGPGNGTTTFNVPDYRGRVGAGKDNMGGSAASRLTTASVNGLILGQTGGAETHTLTTGQIPAHNHTLTDPGHSHQQRRGSPQGANGDGDAPFTYEYGSNEYGLTSSATTGITLASVGGGEAHNNVQPTIVVNKIIKTETTSFLSMLGVDLAAEAASAVNSIQEAGDDQIALISAAGYEFVDAAEEQAIRAEEARDEVVALAVSYRRSGTLETRELIPLLDRYSGMLFDVTWTDDTQTTWIGRTFEWRLAGEPGGPKRNLAALGSDQWVGLYTAFDDRNLSSGEWFGQLPAANVVGLVQAQTDIADLEELGVNSFNVFALNGSTTPPVQAEWSLRGTTPEFLTLTWDDHTITLPASLQGKIVPPDWDGITSAVIFGNSLSDTRDDNGTTVVYWPSIYAASTGQTVTNNASYSSDFVELLKGGLAPIYLTITDDELPAAGDTALITAINGTAPSANPSDGVSFLSVNDVAVVTGLTATGWLAGRRVTVSVPNGGSAVYSIEQDSGDLVTLDGPALFTPDSAFALGKGVVHNATGQNYFYASVPQTYMGHTGYFNAQAFINDAAIRASAMGWPVLEWSVLPQADWATTGTGNPYDAMEAFNALREEFAPQCVMRDNLGRTFLERLQDNIIPGNADDIADVAAGLTPRSLRIDLGGGTFDPLHLSATVNSGQTVSGQQVAAAFIEEALGNLTSPPAINQDTDFRLVATPATGDPVEIISRVQPDAATSKRTESYIQSSTPTTTAAALWFDTTDAGFLTLKIQRG